MDVAAASLQSPRWKRLMPYLVDVIGQSSLRPFDSSRKINESIARWSITPRERALTELAKAPFPFDLKASVEMTESSSAPMIVCVGSKKAWTRPS